MKKILFIIVLTAFLFNCETPEQIKYNENEIIFVVEIDSFYGVGLVCFIVILWDRHLRNK